ncbi:MAG: AAA family ATPase [Promicromonosporaceae bacterium]|nr:AAA family ATPase [Promicromonosporaceae bacterium]
MEYQPRIVDRLLKELLSGTRAVSIEGPRGVGKTSTGLQLANSIVRLDDPAMRAVVSADHQAYLRNLAPPVLIDEWQLDPPIWDAVRRLVDEEKAKGRFLLTGSANPGDTRIHSGAGRFLRLRMRPLAFSERALMEPTVSLAELWNGSDQVTGTSQITLLDYAQEIVDSGFPGIRPEPPRIRAAALTDYLNYALEHEVSALGGPQRRPLALRHWLRAYAAASSGVASYDAISRR